MGDAPLTRPPAAWAGKLDSEFADVAVRCGYLTPAALLRALWELRDSRRQRCVPLPQIVFELYLMTWEEIEAVFDEMFRDPDPIAAPQPRDHRP